MLLLMMIRMMIRIMIRMMIKQMVMMMMMMCALCLNSLYSLLIHHHCRHHVMSQDYVNHENPLNPQPLKLWQVNLETDPRCALVSL